MRITVCQLDANQLDTMWDALKAHTQAHASDFLLLPEMPFSPWFAASPQFDPVVWEQAVEQHGAWIARLPELGVPVVAGSMPVNKEGGRFNAGFSWTADGGLSRAHIKTYLPDEDTFWEASWYQRGPVDFQPIEAGGARLGFQICTEIWFMQHAREYSRQGVHLVLNPRSTLAETIDKWIAGGRAAAVISGAYCLSSNHTGDAQGTPLGGTGWIIDPDGGVLGLTSDTQPFITVNVALSRAETAKTQYPRYVEDSPL